MVWKEAKGWHEEGMDSFFPNMVSCIIMLGVRRWYVARAYVPPNDVPDVNFME